MPSDEVTLGAIARALAVSPVGGDPVVTDVHHDSRRVSLGSLFVAIRGGRADGHDFIAQALDHGAVAVIAEKPLRDGVPHLVVPDSRIALATAAAIVHGRPSRSLTVIGVTGTNGKTTVAHMVEAIARASGRRAGLIGTLGAHIAGEEVPLERTTPESSDLQRLLARMVAQRVELVAMEVSSHALALGRVREIDFDLAAFTNLSRDHLDFHGDMESYFTAKASLFEPRRAARAVVWVDDPWGHRLAGETGIDVVTVSMAGSASVNGTAVTSDASGNSFDLEASGRRSRVRIPLPARFNVANALVAAAACLESGISFEDVCAGLESLDQVPGRFEAVSDGWSYHPIVDYAHTPDAVRAAIEEARAISDGRVIAVLGAGGDRDREKRPLMGRAGSSADVTVVTSDNPRSEDPQAIIRQVAGGVPAGARLIVEPDRRLAIRVALADARPGDIVLVLGKGHERGQEFAGGRVEPFDDRVVVREEAGRLMAEPMR